MLSSVRKPRRRQHCGRAVEREVEVGDRVGVRRKTLSLNSGELGISWSEVAARRFGGDELKWRPTFLQCLLGLQCQSRPSAAYVQKNGLQSRIWRVCHHPLTVSGPKPAFKWIYIAVPQKGGAQNDPDDDSVWVCPHIPRLLPE